MSFYGCKARERSNWFQINVFRSWFAFALCHIKLNKNLETRIHSNQEYPWDDRTKIQILVSRPFAICRAEGNVIALRGRYLFHIACEFVFLYYLDNELNVPWRMLKGWLERIAILLTIKLSSRNECSELWITIVDKKRVYLAFYYMLIFFIFSLNRFYQTRKESIPSLGNYWTNVTASKKKNAVASSIEQLYKGGLSIVSSTRSTTLYTGQYSFALVVRGRI